MRPISYWFAPRMWDGGTAWILGGGYSLPREFGVSEDIITKVMKKELPISTYSEYLSPIHDKHVLGANTAYLFGNWISALYFGDLTFYKNNMLELHDFKNLKVTDTGSLPTQDINQIKTRKIKRLKRDLKSGLSEKQDTIKWGANAGVGAINLACLFGAKRIILVGFDMKANDDGQTHYLNGHAGYHSVTKPKTFERFLKGMPAVLRDAKKMGVEILNTSPDSAIKEFPKVKLKEVL